MSKSQRGMLAAALTAATAAMLVTPSSASAQSIELGLHFSDVLIGTGSNGTTEMAIVQVPSPVELHDRVLTVDFAALSGKITVTADSHAGRTCTTTATKLTCTEHTPTVLFGLHNIFPEIRFKPVAGTPAGTSGEIKVTISAKDVPPVSTTSTVTVGEGVDLAAGPSVELSAAAGGSLSPSLEIGNAGETAVHGTVAVFFGDHAFTVSKQYSNCSYRAGAVTFCAFDEDLLPEKTYRGEESLPFKLRPDTEAPGSETLEINWLTPTEFELFKKEVTGRDPDWFGNPGTGAELDLVETSPVNRNSQVDVDPTNNWSGVSVNVTGDNPADLAAIGGTAAGAAGIVVTLDLGVKNLGPATIDRGRSGDPTSQVNIQLPPGSSLHEMPEGCMALGANGQPDLENPGNLAARGIACWPDGFLFLAGTQATFPVKLKIDEAITNATGKVTIVFPFCEGGCPPIHNESNNSADVVLNATASLPITGVQAGLYAGAGTLMLAAGIVVFMLARRRRFVPREG